MSTLPVTFRASPLPSTFRGTPQQFLDALVARLSIESQDDLTFFVTGSVAPTSDVGPWLKNGVTWYVWDVITGAYIPEVIEFQSLRYIVAQAEPSSVAYTIWIQTDGTGKAQAIKTYSGGAWHDIYEDTFAAMNANINLALNTYPASAKMTGNQTVDVDTSAHKLLFNSAPINPSSAYDATNSRYLAPVAGVYRVSSNLQVDNGTATAASMELTLNVLVDGSNINNPYSGDSTPSPNGARWWPRLSGLVQASAGSAIEIWLTGNDSVNTGNVVVSSNSQFAIELVKAT